MPFSCRCLLTNNKYHIEEAVDAKCKIGAILPHHKSFQLLSKTFFFLRDSFSIDGLNRILLPHTGMIVEFFFLKTKLSGSNPALPVSNTLF